VKNLLKSYQSFFTPATYFSGYFCFSSAYFRSSGRYYRFYYWYC